MTATDASANMIAELNRRAKTAGASDLVTARVATADEPLEAETFDAAVCLDAFFYFADEGLPETILGVVHRALSPGGLFVFDTYNYFLRDPEDEVRVASTESKGWQIYATGKPAPLRHDNLLVYTNRTEITSPEGESHVHEMADTHRHFTPLELSSYCRAAGFSDVLQFPGYGPVVGQAPDDSLLVTVAIK